MFVRECPQAPEAAKALGWVATYCLYSPEAAEAMRWIARDYAGAPGLGVFMIELQRVYGDPFPAKEEVLRAIHNRSPERDVRGAAGLAVARELRLKVQKAGRDKVQYERFLAGAAVPFVQKPEAAEAMVVHWTVEASALCESVRSDVANSDGLRADAESLLRLVLGPNAERSRPE